MKESKFVDSPDELRLFILVWEFNWGGLSGFLGDFFNLGCVFMFWFSVDRNFTESCESCWDKKEKWGKSDKFMELVLVVRLRSFFGEIMN